MSYNLIYDRYSGAGKKLYSSWRNMKTRCRNLKDSSYARYGGRGIKVCDRWMQFKNFADDMGVAPTPQHSIDRIDNSGNYEPGNCRWATRQEQASNRRSNKLVELDGEVRTIHEWADKLGLNRTTVTQRVNAYGWTTEQALKTPVGQNRRVLV